jgi:hypothetical protein
VTKKFTIQEKDTGDPKFFHENRYTHRLRWTPPPPTGHPRGGSITVLFVKNTIYLTWKKHLGAFYRTEP